MDFALHGEREDGCRNGINDIWKPMLIVAESRIQTSSRRKKGKLNEKANPSACLSASYSPFTSSKECKKLSASSCKVLWARRGTGR